MNAQQLSHILIILVILFSSFTTLEAQVVLAAPDYHRDAKLVDQEPSGWQEGARIHHSEGVNLSPIYRAESSAIDASNTLASPTSVPTTVWSVPIGGTETSVYDIATDSNANVYVTGRIHDSSSQINHAFVIKLDDTGAMQWIYSFEGSNNSIGQGIFVDQIDGIYLTGEIKDPASGSREILLAKFDSSGTLLWQESYDNSLGDIEGNDIAVDGLGNIYITGYKDTQDFSTDAVVVRIDPISHQALWSKSLGGAYFDFGYGITTDINGNIYVTGVDDVSGDGNSSGAFVVRLDEDGNTDWSITLGNASTYNGGNDIAVDNLGNIYIGGISGETWGTPLRSFSGNPYDDGFVAKLNSNDGELEWNTFLGGTSFDDAIGISLDNGRVFASGSSGEIWGNPISGAGDSFVARLDNDGNLIWNLFLGGEGGSVGGIGNVATSNGVIYATSDIFSDGYSIDYVNRIDDPIIDCSDTFEPDDTLATGSPIIIGEEQRHSLCPQSDEDWVNFDTSINDYFNRNFLVETFDLEPNSIHPNSDTQVTVEDETGTHIGTNQSRGLGPFPGSLEILKYSGVVWHPASDGVFNIKVFPQKQINEQEGSGYSLRLANPLSMVDPVDQGSWSPTRVNVPPFRGLAMLFILHNTFLTGRQNWTN